MDLIRLGAVCRALRIKKRWRQVDLATRAAVSEARVSSLERGLAGELHVDELMRIVSALGGQLDLVVRWQGGELDRLLNARHSALHESVARSFADLSGWVIAPEVSFNVYGERGVIDILASHAASQTLLVIELKTEIVDINDLMGAADKKRRLAPGVARDRGWVARAVALGVIVADSKTNRRRVQGHARTIRNAMPLEGRTVKSWLRAPAGPMSCLSFWTDPTPTNAKSNLATIKRVRTGRGSTSRA
jgi:transcriptional regulator with XRE-family HTH domain